MLADFPKFLADHASNERKAAALAMEMTTRYPDKISLVKTAVKIAQDEILHFQKVFDRMCQMGAKLVPDQKCAYARHLRQKSRSKGLERLLDHLLINSMIETRGMERFGLLALNHPDPDWQSFFTELSLGEKGHATVYVHEAKKIFDPSEVDQCRAQWIEIEAEAIVSAPISYRLFS